MGDDSQGRWLRATLGFVAESLWDSMPHISATRRGVTLQHGPSVPPGIECGVSATWGDFAESREMNNELCYGLTQAMIGANYRDDNRAKDPTIPQQVDFWE